MTRAATPDASPGALLLHPAVLGALAVVAVNDHWAKARFHDAATGKLSDVAGVFVLPLVLVSLAELTRWSGTVLGSWSAPVDGRSGPGSRASLAVAVAVTGLGFAVTKLVAGAGTAYVVALGGLRWLALATVRLPSGEGWPPFPDVQLVADRTDLLVLPVLVLTWAVGTRSIGAGRAARAPGSAGASTRAHGGGVDTLTDVRPSSTRGSSTWLVP